MSGAATLAVELAVTQPLVFLLAERGLGGANFPRRRDRYATLAIRRADQITLAGRRWQGGDKVSVGVVDVLLRHILIRVAIVGLSLELQCIPGFQSVIIEHPQRRVRRDADHAAVVERQQGR